MGGTSIVQWERASVSTGEAKGKALLKVVRTGNTKSRCTVQYKTEAGSAKQGETTIGASTSNGMLGSRWNSMTPGRLSRAPDV